MPQLGRSRTNSSKVDNDSNSSSSSERAKQRTSKQKKPQRHRNKHEDNSTRCLDCVAGGSCVETKKNKETKERVPSAAANKQHKKNQDESITNSDDDEEQRAEQSEEQECEPALGYKRNEYRLVTEYDCSVRNWDDNVKELECAPPERISNCWNCNYPLTKEGYFPSVEIDWSDKSSVLVQAAALLETLRPLPKQTFGIPVHRTTDNTIELIGSCHSVACVKRYMIDTMHYNPSDVDTMIALMARNAGLPLDQLQTAAPVNTLKHRGGIYTYEQYDCGPLIEVATPVSTRLLHRMPQKIHVVQKGGQQKVRSMYEAYLKQAKPSLNSKSSTASTTNSAIPDTLETTAAQAVPSTNGVSS